MQAAAADGGGTPYVRDISRRDIGLVLLQNFLMCRFLTIVGMYPKCIEISFQILLQLFVNLYLLSS